MSYTATTKRVWLPKRGHFAHFVDRQMMKRGAFKRGVMTGTLPPPTLPIDWTKSDVLSFPYDGNDNYGDCMYAAGCHADNTFTGNVGTESVFNLQTIIKDYLALSGGDNGLDEGMLVGAWKQGLASTPAACIIDSIDIDPTNTALMQACIDYFGGILFMLDVPDAWINEFDTGCIWDGGVKADSNNGHGTWLNGVNAAGQYKLQTWGSHCWLTPAGVKVCDPSAFVVLSMRWFDAKTGYAPNKKHYTQLSPYWVQLGGTTPPPSPFPAPGPSPPAPPPPGPPAPPPPVGPPAPPPPTPIPATTGMWDDTTNHVILPAGWQYLHHEGAQIIVHPSRQVVDIPPGWTAK